MREALDKLSEKGEKTPCKDRPAPFVEVRQSPEEAAALCGRGTDNECPVLALCEPLGFSESVYADNMVYGGYSWRRGLPMVSETAYQSDRGKVRGKERGKD